MCEYARIMFNVVIRIVQVYTVDATNQSAVREALYEIMAYRDHTPFVPHEFTQQVRSAVSYYYKYLR